MKTDHWHALLIQLKSSAYGWRQMILYLSFLPSARLDAFLQGAETHLAEQGEDFHRRFDPAMRSLTLAASARPLDSGARRFLGWSKARHWMIDAATVATATKFSGE